MRPTVLLSASALLASVAGAQQDSPRDRAKERAESREREYTVTINGDGYAYSSRRSDDSTRAWLGLATASSGERDTLGLLVQEVVPGSPADKAGLEEGMRLITLNGVSLKLSAADADDPAMRGVLQRRLTRTLRDVKPGAEVSVGVMADGRPKTLTVKTIAASDAPDAPNAWNRQRAVIGVSLGAQASRRDTAGVFISAVTEDGPADKAGVMEGDRVAAINGQDVRVSRDDAGDEAAAQARIARFTRILRNVKPGDDVELRVVSGGRQRTVKVKTVRASELGDAGMTFAMPRVEGFVMPSLPTPPRAPVIRFFDDDAGRVRVRMQRGRMTI